jgi:putative ABC transport system permease protein
MTSHLPAARRARPSIALAWRQTLRDFRAGELRLLALAVMLAVAALTAVGFFADRLNNGLARDAGAAARRRRRRRQRQADAARTAATRRRAGLAYRHSVSFPEHGPRARRQGRRHAAGGRQGRERRLPAARPAAA